MPRRLFHEAGRFTSCISVLPCPDAAKDIAANPFRAASACRCRGRAANADHEYTLPPDKLQKAKALYDLRGTLRIIDTVFSLLVFLGILYFGVATRYRDWAEKAGKSRFVQALVFVPLFLLTLTVLALPLDAYQHSISLQYGLSVQSWGSWFGDVLKGQAISLVLTTILLWGWTWLIRKSPRSGGSILVDCHAHHRIFHLSHTRCD